MGYILPPVCVRCGQAVQDYGLCADCFSQIIPITSPCCAKCGLPFQNRMQGRYCGVCIKSPPPCISRSAVVYGTATRDIILALKYGDNTQVVPYMASKMVSALSSDIKMDIDIIVPVPLHPRRLWRRQYNQSALLGYYIKKHLHIPLCTQSVIRHHFKSPQGGKSVSARHHNVKFAFKVKDTTKIKGKTVLIVDDVYTSGATVHAVSKVLLKAGATKVYAITYARTVL